MGVLLEPKELVMYGLRCTNIEGWGGIRMGAGVYATYSSQYAFNDLGSGRTMAFSMLFTGLTAYYKNRVRAPLTQVCV